MLFNGRHPRDHYDVSTTCIHLQDLCKIASEYKQPFYLLYYSVILQHKSATDAIYLNSKLHSELAIIKMQKSRKVKDENALTKLLFLKYIACTLLYRWVLKNWRCSVAHLGCCYLFHFNGITKQRSCWKAFHGEIFENDDPHIWIIDL